MLTLFPAWVTDQELASITRRTNDGPERARQQRKVLGPPRKLRPHQVETMRRMLDEGTSPEGHQWLRLLGQCRSEVTAEGGTGLRMPDILHPPHRPKGAPRWTATPLA